MKNTRFIFIFAALMLVLLNNTNAYAQGSGYISYPKERLERGKQAAALNYQGESKLAAGDANAALLLFDKARLVYPELPGYYGSARAYVALGRNEEARAAYQKFIKFQARFGDYHVGNSADMSINPAVPPLMNYAILLSKMGQQQDAIDVYHRGLRSLNAGDFGEEIVALTRTFGTDTGDTAYTPAKLQAAAHLALAIERHLYDGASQKDVEQAVALDPEWKLAQFYKKMIALYTKKTPDKKAVSEADWRPAYNALVAEQPQSAVGPHILRENLPALKKAREELIKRKTGSVSVQ